MLRIIILKTKLAIISNVPSIKTPLAKVVPMKTAFITTIRSSTTFTSLEVLVSTTWSKRKWILGSLIRRWTLRWRSGLSCHKSVEHLRKLSQLLLNNDVSGFLLGDVVMASFQGFGEVSKMGTVSHEKFFFLGRKREGIRDG